MKHLERRCKITTLRITVAEDNGTQRDEMFSYKIRRNYRRLQATIIVFIVMIMAFF